MRRVFLNKDGVWETEEGPLFGQYMNFMTPIEKTENGYICRGEDDVFIEIGRNEIPPILSQMIEQRLK